MGLSPTFHQASRHVLVDRYLAGNIDVGRQ
jgi:hypothetical protein